MTYRPSANPQKWVVDIFADEGLIPLKASEHRACSEILEFDTEKEAQEMCARLKEKFKDEDFSNGYGAPLMGFGLSPNDTMAFKVGFAQCCTDFDLPKHMIPDLGDHPVYKYLDPNYSAKKAKREAKEKSLDDEIEML
jgi:isocitrate lyase